MNVNLKTTTILNDEQVEAVSELMRVAMPRLA